MYYYQKRILEEAKKYANADTKSESATKAALEDYLYSIPKAAIDELRPVMKTKPSTQRMAKITAILKKHGFAAKFMGAYPAAVVQDYYDTFFGESVEVDGEQLSEAPKSNIKKVGKPTKIAGMVIQDYDYEGKKYMVLQSFSGRETVVKMITPQGTKEVWRKSGVIQPEDAMRQYAASGVKEEVDTVSDQLSEAQEVVGKYRFNSFTEGSISGWMISVQGVGEVGFIEAPAKKNTKTSVAPHKVFKTKGQSEGNPKLVLTAYPDSSTRLVNDKEIRFGPRQLFKAIAMWMDKYGKVMTEETQFVEETEVSEQFKAGDKVKVPHKGKMVSGKIVRFDDGGTSKAQQHGGGYVVDVGEPASILVPKQKVQKEEVEVNETWYDSPTLSKKDADSLLDDLESAYKKGGLRGQFKVPNGDSGPVWEMIQGLTEFLRGEPKNMVAYVLKGVKDFLSPTDRNDSRIKKVFESFSTEGNSVSEAWWNSETLSKREADSLLDDLESAYKKGGLRGTFKVPNGDSSRVWEMIQDLPNFLRGEPKNMISYVLLSVKDFLSPTDTNDPRIKKVFESFSTEGNSILENAYAAREAQAKEIADKIKQVARERGVRVYGEGRVLTATKEFPKGDMQAFHKAYNDCHAVVTYMRFTKNSNEWGCSSAGFGVGAQECVKAGRVTINKSGDGGSLILKKL